MKLYKLYFLIIALFYNTACETYYENDKNPFKSSGQCDNDLYSYSKTDLPPESFGKIGVVSNTQEYPRAGIDSISLYSNNRKMEIRGTFSSLCKSSLIDKVRIDLSNFTDEYTYYPNIRTDYSGSFITNIDMNKNDDYRCFFNNKKFNAKTWAKDEDGNSYHANKYAKSVAPNVRSDISWDFKYEYTRYSEYDNKYKKKEIKNEEEIKQEEDGNYTYEYRYEYEFEYEYTYANKYNYEHPVNITFYANNDYDGEYFEMSIQVFSSLKVHSISNTNRQVTLSTVGSDIKYGNDYNFKISLTEKLDTCSIASHIRTRHIDIPNTKVYRVDLDVLIDTKKTKLNESKHFIRKIPKEGTNES